jgi:hypothetical protein
MDRVRDPSLHCAGYPPTSQGNHRIDEVDVNVTASARDCTFLTWSLALVIRAKRSMVRCTSVDLHAPHAPLTTGDGQPLHARPVRVLQLTAPLHSDSPPTSRVQDLQQPVARGLRCLARPTLSEPLRLFGGSCARRQKL